MYRYEDMVDKKFEALNAYLGFETEADRERPSGTCKEKMVRKKTYGDWRHWYTADYVKLFKPACTLYIEAITYLKSILFTTFAGLPTANTPSGISFETTLPAPITVFSPMVTGPVIITPLAIHAPSFI